MAYHPFRDFWLKAVAVAIAVLLWFTVAGEPVVERGLEIPLELENVPAELEISSAPPDTVSVRVRGTSRVVSRLDSSEVAAVLDLGDEGPGRRLFDMFSDRVEVPPGIEITSVVPATVTLTLERKGVPRMVPVVPDIEGEPAPGLAVGSIETDPDSVEVIGPETRLAELREALTGPVSVAGASEDVVTEVTVVVADPTLRLVEPVSARVVVQIVAAPVEKTLHDVPIEIQSGQSHGVSVEPKHVAIGVRGTGAAIAAIAETDLRASIDLDGLPPGSYRLAVQIESIDGSVVVSDIEPSSVQVSLR
jgi:hypothetical protein